MKSRKQRHTGRVTYCEECATVCDGPCRLDMMEDQRRLTAAQAWAMGLQR